MSEPAQSGSQSARLDSTETIGMDRLGQNGDRFYEHLMAAHDGLSPEASAHLNARLVLILANHVGDADKLDEILDAARLGVEP